MYLFFDTETTGVPKNMEAPLNDFNNWPRMVQIAWLLYDKERNVIVDKNYIIFPSDFSIPPQASAIHSITTTRAKFEGKLLKKF